MEVPLDICGRRTVKALLLIYLCVVKAAADCPRPQLNGRVILTNEALLMNNFLEDTLVTLECGNGYVKESGTGVMTCMAGNWTEPDLVCKKRDCGPPKPQPNMSFNISAGTLFGDTIVAVCDKGYQISGSSYKQCYATGWSGRAKCEIVTCEVPGEVPNSSSSWDSEDSPRYGEIINYVCNEGYTLVGKKSIMCSETGKFDSPPPECKGVTTEDTIATNMPTPAATPPAQEVPTSTDSPARPTAHRDQSSTTSATQSASPSPQGGRGILSAEEKAATTSATPTTVFQDKNNRPADTSTQVGYVPVIVSVICVLLVASVVVLALHKFLLRRKGSVNGTRPLC